MLFEYRYFGNTVVDSSVGSTGLSFAPDARREPTYFSGKLRQRLPFRECMSALHDVVVADLRYKPKDRSAYLEWAKGREEIDQAELLATRKETRAQIEAISAELAALRHKRSSRWSFFHNARQKYFDWLYRRNVDAWFVLDPVVTVHPDEVAFECFSQDESSYGRVSCGYDVFGQMGDFACGTTNVDYSQTLYDEFQKIRDYKETSLVVDPRGFEVQTGADAGWREVKIDLPDSWVRGFLQVSAAMTLGGGARFELHPLDVHNLCLVLRRHRELRGPRSLRFQLEPGRPVRVVVEPWGTVIDCPRSTYAGDEAHEIRVWGRRRLHTLERLIPVARRFTVVLLGHGMPSFWIADCGDIRFTLGLSGWTANDWSKQSNFDLLAPRAEVDSGTAAAVFAALKQSWYATPEELASRFGLERGTVESALMAWTQAGRVVYDLDKGVYRARELSREPLDLSKLRWSNEREEKAARLTTEGQVRLEQARLDDGGHTHLVGRVARERVGLRIDPDHRLADGHCTCAFHFRNKLRRGPCEHLLALRLAHERGHRVVAAVDAPTAPRATPSEPSVAADSPRLTARTAHEQEAERFLGMLVERELIEVTPGLREELVEDLRLILATADRSARVDFLWDLLERSQAIEEFYLGYEELDVLLEEWG